MVTVLPTEPSVAATLSLTERCAISMTKARPMDSPRIRMIETVRVALRNALRMPLPAVVTYLVAARPPPRYTAWVHPDR